MRFREVMKAMLLALVGTLAVPAAAQSDQRFVFFGEDENGEYYLDRVALERDATGSRSGAMVVRVLLILAQPEDLEGAEVGAVGWEVGVDCSRRQTREVAEFYSGSTWWQTLYRSVEGASDWSAATPESVGAHVLQAVCDGSVMTRLSEPRDSPTIIDRVDVGRVESCALRDFSAISMEPSRPGYAILGHSAKDPATGSLLLTLARGEGILDIELRAGPDLQVEGATKLKAWVDGRPMETAFRQFFFSFTPEGPARGEFLNDIRRGRQLRVAFVDNDDGVRGSIEYDIPSLAAPLAALDAVGWRCGE